MLREVLDAILTVKQRRAGFWLSEDVDGPTLYRGDKAVAHFTIHATPKTIRHEANRLMKAV